MIAGMSRRFKYRDLEFWAENGMICVVDYRVNPPEYKTDSVREFLLRAQGRIAERDRVQTKIYSAPGSSSNASRREQVEEIQKCIEGMIECTRIAKHQGDPNDPKVQAWICKDGEMRRRKVFAPQPQVVEYNSMTPISDLIPKDARLVK